jgi:hypothetical protein
MANRHFSTGSSCLKQARTRLFFFNIFLSLVVASSPPPPVIILEKDQLSSKHQCIGDQGWLRGFKWFGDASIAQGGEFSRVCRFENVCLQQTAPDGSEFSTPNGHKNFVSSKLIYFRGPNHHMPIGVFDHAEYYRFPENDFQIIVSWGNCVPPDCSFVNITDVDGYIPVKSSYVEHRVGLMVDWSTTNLGHLLVDFMMALFGTQLSLDMEPTYDFQMVSTWNLHGGVSLEPKFGPAYSRHRMRSLSDMYKYGTQNGSNPNGLVCFKELVAGNLDFLTTSKRYSFTAPPFRKWMLRNIGLPSTFVPRQHLIVLMGKHVEGTKGRGIRNLQEVNESFSTEFGHRFIMPDFATMSARDQMHVMQRATVFIAPGSGGSFIGLFLSRGAVFLQFDVFNNETKRSIPFGLEVNVWTQLGYITYWRYLVDSSEFYFDRDVANQTYDAGLPWTFTGDYTLNVSRLMGFVYLALDKAAERIHLDCNIPFNCKNRD